MFESLTKKLKQGESLSADEMSAAMEQIVAGAAEHDVLVSFLTALRDKGETVTEITAAAQVMRRHAVACSGLPDTLVDTCGTGGDQKGTFNISTAAAFVVAGAGVPVAKHGNRSVSSRAGSADLLEALGVKIDLPPEAVVRCIERVGIGFFFARRYHPAMKAVAAARQAIATRTIFNLLGPLTNPAGARRQLIGVFARPWCEPMAQVLARLGSERAMVVHGDDGIDEITTTSRTFVAELKGGQVSTYWLDPREWGLSLCRLQDLQGGDAERNALYLRGLLNGYESPLQEVVRLNAAAALVVAGRVSDLALGLEVAEKSLSQGMALAKLEGLIEESQRP